MWTIHAAIHCWRQAVLLLFASVCCVWLLFSSFFLLFTLASKASVLRYSLKSSWQMLTAENDIVWTILSCYVCVLFFTVLPFLLSCSALVFLFHLVLISYPQVCPEPCFPAVIWSFLIVYIPYLYPLLCHLVFSHLLLSVVLPPPVIWLQRKETYIQISI